MILVTMSPVMAIATNEKSESRFGRMPIQRILISSKISVGMHQIISFTTDSKRHFAFFSLD